MRVMLINPPIDSVLENGNVSPVTQYLFYGLLRLVFSTSLLCLNNMATKLQ